MGCAPGSGCCDECGGHGSTVGRIGDASCDQDGNCYDPVTGVYTPSPVFNSSAGLMPNLNAAGTWLSQNSTLLVGLGALLGIVALATGSKGRR